MSRKNEPYYEISFVFLVISFWDIMKFVILKEREFKQGNQQREIAPNPRLGNFHLHSFIKD